MACLLALASPLAWPQAPESVRGTQAASSNPAVATAPEWSLRVATVLQVMQHLRTSAGSTLTDQEMLAAALRGMLQANAPGDPLLPPGAGMHVAFMDERLRQSGLKLDQSRAPARVLEVDPGSAGAKASLSRGDRILAIDGHTLGADWPADIRHWSLSLLRPMSLLVQSDAAPTPRTVQLDMTGRSWPSVMFTTAAQGVLRLRLPPVSDAVVRDVMQALSDTAPPQGLVLDLRGCSGGGLHDLADLAGLFLPDGAVLGIHQAFVAGNTYPVVIKPRASALPRTIRISPEWRSVPLVVWIDDTTQGGAEMLAAALGDLKRAVVVGRRSPGVGLVRAPVPLPDGSTAYVSSGRLLRADGRALQQAGVAPDIMVPAGNDTDELAAVVAALRKAR